MDQLKVFLKQCMIYRFWIICGISLLLPVIGYFVGSGAMIDATKAQETAIKGAQTDVQKYTAPKIPNHQYQPIVAEKKAVLTEDVDATWRKLFAVQAPLLRWPESVESRFRTWGRKWPENVDRGQVQKAIIDYTIEYRPFVSNVYKTFKPWNPEDGSGIVAAPPEDMLLSPAPFTLETPPDLGKVWAEQERLWVVTALLDVVAKVNAGVGAKDWDGAAIKQVSLLEVGTSTAQDQQSLAKGVALDDAPVLSADGTSAPPPPPTPAGGGEGAMAGMMGMMGGQTKSESVKSIHTDSPQQFKILPIRMTVLVDQARLMDFLVGLENSPMTIQVLEPEIAKPASPVVKPVYGERMNYGMMGGGPEAGPMGGMGGEAMSRMMGGRGPGGPTGRQMSPEAGMMSMMGGMMGGNNAAPVVKKGTDIRNVNKAALRKDQDKEAAKSKTATKSKTDLYYNVIEVTVYGQARFYNAPPPAQPSPSTSTAQAPAPAPDAGPAPAPADPQAATPPAEAPKATDAPKANETPAPAPTPEAPKADPSATKTDTPAPKS